MTNVMKKYENKMILAEDAIFDMDDMKTGLNNNVCVIGCSGAGKSRFVVEPNICNASGNYIVADPKGCLRKKFGPYLEKECGYRVLNLDFVDPSQSNCHWNLFSSIRPENAEADILSIAHNLIYSDNSKIFSKADPFWDRSAEMLLCSLLALVYFSCDPKEQTLASVLKLLDKFSVDENNPMGKNNLDMLMDSYEISSPGNFASKCYHRFRVAAGRTLKSIVISLYSEIGLYDSHALSNLMASDTINIKEIGFGETPTILFVTISDMDRSLDRLVNTFFSCCMKELVYAADCTQSGRLNIPTRFILDDFCTATKIVEMPRWANSIRSRNISVMLFVQSETQLYQTFGEGDAKSILASCDNILYLGGSDVFQSKQIGERTGMPFADILNMSIGTVYVFRRGSKALRTKLFNRANMPQLVKSDNSCKESIEEIR